MRRLTVPGAVLLAFALLLALLAGIPVSAAGNAPIAENLEFETYRGTSMGGSLTASDPDGDRLSFELSTPPVKGTLDLNPDGRFVYTPAEGKRGRDYFGYRAVDPEGNRSQEATVLIRIQKPKSKVSYSDTAGLACGRAAQRLAEEGIFVGECLAGRYVFDPDRPVTREEFLVLCLKLSGAGTVENLRSTGFSDDGEIAVWAKPYVSAALRDGVISGMSQESGPVVFAPGREISALEAAVMLDRALELTDAAPAWFGYDESVPAWARQSAANAAACGILTAEDARAGADTVLTRAEAAGMLDRALDVLRNR